MACGPRSPPARTGDRYSAGAQLCYTETCLPDICSSSWGSGMADELATAAIASTPTAAAQTMALSRQEARGVMLAAQSLLDPPQPRPGAEDVQAMVERLGVVQIDTINVVRRSQYLVLWSRLGAYNEADFDALLYPRRANFEYWAHAASILPMSDFPYYLAVMEEARRHLWAGDR